MKRLPLLLLLLLLPAQAFALIDLIGPADNTVLSGSTVNFEYYVSMPHLATCTLNLAGQQFVDTDVQSNSMNGVQMQNLPGGTYPWSFNCSNGTTMQSLTRTLIIDNQSPTVTLISPVNNTTVKVIALDFIPYDETANALSCQILWGSELLDTVTVNRNTHYLRNYTPTPGNGTLTVTCNDRANSASAVRQVTLVPELKLHLQLDRAEYGLNEAPKLTISTLPGANVTVDICPDQPGFVQCTSALIATSSFPQEFTLPTMNRTGGYIVDGMAGYGGQTRFNKTSYVVTNTIQLAVEKSASPVLNRSFNLSATVNGGIAPYRFTWQLSNGTTITGSSVVTLSHNAAGNYTQVVTVTDNASNSRKINISYTVAPSYNVIFQVRDQDSGAAIVDAELDLTHDRSNIEENVRTIQGGIAYATMQEGGHRVFISAPNYEYFLEEYYINASTTIEIKLKRAAQNTPQVSIISPANNSAVGSPVTIAYDATHSQALTCALLFADGQWYKSNGTGAAKGSFVRDLAPGNYRARIECTDTQSRTGAATVDFTVQDVVAVQAATAQLADEQRLQDAVSRLDAMLAGIESYPQKEREAAAILGFDKQLRNTKRAVQQAIRDINDLQFRHDLNADAKAAERKRILDSINKAISGMPTGISVTDSKSFVKYIEEKDLAKVTASFSAIGIQQKPKQLLEEQQKFTVSTRILQVEQQYGEEKKSSTIISRTFTYAEDLGPEYQLYELIPPEVAKGSELQLLTKGEVLGDTLRFGQERNITYIIPRRVDLTRLEEIKTVIARPYVEQNMITGFAVFSGNGGSSTPLLILVGLIALAYLIYYFDLVKQAKFLVYSFGKKEKVHYVNVLINDAVAELDANNYEKAEMLYKEVRMSYDALTVLEKNELYEDIVDLVHRMDAYYFNMVMIELDAHLKAGDMEQAIACYERVTHIYERLDPEHQQQLIVAVTGMAQRLGVAA